MDRLSHYGEYMFTVKFYDKDGKLKDTYEGVPMVQAYLVGVQVDGLPYKPDDTVVERLLPYRYRKAFNRAHKWWLQSNGIVTKCYLVDYRVRDLGTLVARYNGKG